MKGLTVPVHGSTVEDYIWDNLQIEVDEQNARFKMYICNKCGNMSYTDFDICPKCGFIYVGRKKNKRMAKGKKKAGKDLSK